MTENAGILITGDFCPVNRTGEIIREGGAGSLLNDFLPAVKSAGLAVTNLECPLTDSDLGIKKIGPLMRAPVNTASLLSDWGFDLVTLANNHIMDYGNQGISSTISACVENNIGHVGAGESLINARQPYYCQPGKYKLAVLNFAENEFSTTHGDSPGANPLDIIENSRDIVTAKSMADFVLVIVHGGHEMFNLPSPRIKSTLRFFADAGASAVIQHHAHCYSGFELYNDVPIFYGLGNFIFDIPTERNQIWNIGYAVELIPGSKLTFRVIPYEQSASSAGVRLLTGESEENFYRNIQHLNAIIADDNRLMNEFEKYCRRVEKRYRAFLEPHSSGLLHYLRHRHLFPSLLSKRKERVYLNLYRCESHREVVMHLLSESVLNQIKH
jgi:poly-gamma-glutamate synthesis protein (capsule biosynthesis protein)